MTQCAGPLCNKLARSQCSVCLKEWYCSGECQEADWKKHKKICKILKRLSNQLQPYLQVVHVIGEVLQAPGNVVVLNHLLRFTEFQFGERILGKAHRQSENRGRIDNWTVDIEIMISINHSLINIYRRDTSLSLIDRNDIELPCHERILKILKPWTLCRSETLSNEKIDKLYFLLSKTEMDVASIHSYRNQFDIAGSHHQRALAYVRQCNEDGDTKTTLLLKVLKAAYTNQSLQGNYAGALTFAEEAYNCVAIAYNPVHPQVQEAAGTLIECLIHNGNLYDAERYAEVTLDSLKDPANKMDQEGKEVALGHYSLGRVICAQKGDLVRAEMLTRESLRIRAKVHGNDHWFVGSSISLLADIMSKQGKVSDDVKELYERSLAIKVKHEGLDGSNTSIGNTNLGVFYLNRATTEVSSNKRKEYLILAKSYLIEAFRINTKIFGPAHHNTIDAASDLSTVNLLLSES